MRIINFKGVKQDISERQDGRDEARKLSSIVDENSDLIGVASPGTPRASRHANIGISHFSAREMYEGARLVNEITASFTILFWRSWVGRFIYKYLLLRYS